MYIYVWSILNYKAARKLRVGYNAISTLRYMLKARYIFLNVRRRRGSLWQCAQTIKGNWTKEIKRVGTRITKTQVYPVKPCAIWRRFIIPNWRSLYRVEISRFHPRETLISKKDPNLGRRMYFIFYQSTFQSKFIFSWIHTNIIIFISTSQENFFQRIKKWLQILMFR